MVEMPQETGLKDGVAEIWQTGERTSAFDRGRDLDLLIDGAGQGLTELQGADGHWVFELEADATIPSEYILLNHYLGEIDDPLERQIAAYLRRTQGEHGGWPLYLRRRLRPQRHASRPTTR